MGHFGGTQATPDLIFVSISARLFAERQKMKINPAQIDIKESLNKSVQGVRGMLHDVIVLVKNTHVHKITKSYLKKVLCSIFVSPGREL